MLEKGRHLSADEAHATPFGTVAFRVVDVEHGPEGLALALLLDPTSFLVGAQALAHLGGVVAPLCGGFRGEIVLLDDGDHGAGDLNGLHFFPLSYVLDLCAYLYSIAYNNNKVNTLKSALK